MTQESEKIAVEKKEVFSSTEVLEKIVFAKDAITHRYYKTAQSRTGHVGYLECDYVIGEKRMFLNLITENRMNLPADYRLVEISADDAKKLAKEKRTSMGMGVYVYVAGKKIKKSELEQGAMQAKEIENSTTVKESKGKERKISRSSIIDKCFIEGIKSEEEILEEVMKQLPNENNKSVKYQIKGRVALHRKNGHTITIDNNAKIKMTRKS